MDENNDDFQLDLGIDEKEAQDAVAKGLQTGVKKGLQKGASSGVVPIAEQAAEQAIRNLASGGSGGSQAVKEALNNVAGMYQTEALRAMVEKMKQPTQPAPAPSREDGISRFNTLVQTLNSLGVNIKDLGLDHQDLMLAAYNPDLLPIIVMGRKSPKHEGRDFDMLSLVLTLLTKQQPQPPPPQPVPSSNDTLATIISAFLQQQQAQQTQQMQLLSNIMDIQNKYAQELMEARLKALEPYLQQRSFAEELQELQQKIDGLKGIGLLNAGQGRSDKEAELDFEAKKMSLELRKEELQQERELKMKEKELEQKQKEFQMLGQLLAVGKNIFKGLPIGQAPAQEQPTPPPPDDTPATPPTPPFTLGRHVPITPPPAQRPTRSISERVTAMLRKIQQAIPDDDGSDSNA